MDIIRPDYYDTFRCLAGACPDSCCKEWAVVVDDASAERYRALPGALGDQLRAAMQLEDGDTILALDNNRRCPMWREDGLCRIQAQLGEDGLCDTCRQFPRLRHDYGSFVELGLELSCPEAARLILSDSHRKMIASHTDGSDEADYDSADMSVLLRTREEILNFLEDTHYTPGEALAVMLIYGYAVQSELDGGVPARLDPVAALRQAHSLAASGSIRDILSFYQQLEILTPSWNARLACPASANWCDTFRTLARYFVSRYWLQAISDYDLVGRVKFTIVSCLVIKELGCNLTETAQLYSKEIENDIDNLEAILDGAYNTPALADIRLLGLLVGKT